jgi:hypothetical protein
MGHNEQKVRGGWKNIGHNEQKVRGGWKNIHKLIMRSYAIFGVFAVNIVKMHSIRFVRLLASKKSQTPEIKKKF